LLTAKLHHQKWDINQTFTQSTISKHNDPNLQVSTY
jgi:hypothetical protein